MTEVFNRGYQKSLRKYLRNNATRSEKVFWKHLKERRVDGFKFKRQCGIGNYIVDFYCPRLELVIEIDGNIHDLPEVKERDLIREEYLRSLGLTIVRFTNEDVLYNSGKILDELEVVCHILEQRNHPDQPPRSSGTPPCEGGGRFEKD